MTNDAPSGGEIITDRASTDPARDRVARLFRFVAALYEQRNPALRRIEQHAWVLRFDAVPEHPTIALTRAVDGADADADADAPPLLVCRRPATTSPPLSPVMLEPWLGDAWGDCRAQPAPLADRNEKNAEGETVVVAFADDPARVTALAEYRLLWDRWAANERVTLEAAALFEKLYELHGTLQRDGEQFELVVADGILAWDRPGTAVRHPLLARPVRLAFDPRLPEFRIIDGDAETEFAAPLFRGMSDVDGVNIARLSEELAALDTHPLARAAIGGFLAAVATTLSPKGRYLGDEAPGPERTDPVIGRQPVFYLRKRTAGFARAIDAIVADIAAGGVIPRALMNVVAAALDGEPPAFPAGDDRSASAVSNVLTDDDILFTKPTNREQLDIARCLESDDCVLVQGPPGTGKTHTIANLLGHLLAQGKSVLVVSHTTKALKVVREKVVDALQPLCVSVLDSKEDDAALKSSVEGIVERIGNADPARLDREVAALTAERARLLAEARALRTAIFEARFDEQREIVLDGASVRPIDAAKEVAAGVSLHDWIPAPVIHGRALPLTYGDLVRLYATNESVRPEDERALAVELPEPSTMLAPLAFAALCAERVDLAAIDRDVRADLWNAPPDAPAEVLDAPLDAARDAAARFRDLPSWTARLVDAGRSPAERDIWDSLIAEIASVRERVVAAQTSIVMHAPRLAPGIAADRAAEVYGAIAHEVTVTGKSPGFLTLLTRPEWKAALEGATVGAGGKPRLPEHFAALAALAEVEQRRAALRRRWSAQVEAIGGPSGATLGADIEVGAQRLVPQMLAALDWRSRTWALAEGAIASVGLAWANLKSAVDAARPDLDEAHRIVSVVDERLEGIFIAEHARRRWDAVERALSAFRTAAFRWPASDVALALREAIERYDSRAYTSAYTEMERLRHATIAVRERATLLTTLEEAAPGWATAVRARDGMHGRGRIPGDAAAAWRWRQFEEELQRREQLSLPDLIARLDSTNRRLLETTKELVDRRAWRAQVQRTTPDQRQALMGFAEAKRRIGRGTGKRAAHFARVARARMVDAQSAVPVWIMPVVKAAEVFDPKHRFDVVIVDEASQSDVTGLLAFYLGSQIVVVGDDEQVSPSAVGERVDEAQHLIDELLADIPNKQFFDGKQSLYDIAKRSFGRTICLLEHFRCVPEIIQFSNSLSYDGKIRPLREPGPDRLMPAVVEHRITAGTAERRRNEREARAIASLIAAAIAQPEYDGKTFGVISLVGDEQAYRIEEIVRAIVPPTEIAARRLLAGSAAHFQGDERNVMFLSVVDSGEGVPLPLRDTRPFQQRFNVAASRAQDQMWVVHSLDHALELKPNDLRRRLIEHARDAGAAQRMRDVALRAAESPFEEEVLRRLAGAGFAVQSQFAVGAYRIDIVVGSPDGPRLAVECDGERYHTIEKLREDSERQAILERLGWRFERIRGSSFYRNADAAMAVVFARLERMAIRPGVVDSVPAATVGDALAARVRARADVIAAELDERLASAQIGVRRSWRGARRASPSSASELETE